MNTHKTIQRRRENKEVGVSFRLPRSIVQQIDEAARLDGSSRSLIIRRALIQKFMQVAK